MMYLIQKKLYGKAGEALCEKLEYCNTFQILLYIFVFIIYGNIEKKYNCYPDCCTGCPNEHRNSVTILICLCKWSFDLVMPIKKAVICLLELITYFFFMFLLHTSDIRNSCLQTQTTVVPFQCLSCKNVKEHNSLLQFAWNIL